MVCPLRGANERDPKDPAILVADIVGYGRLAGADEDRILARLGVLRSDLIDPAIAVHNARIVKRSGDGSIIEFRGVVDAVCCAIEVPNRSATWAWRRNAAAPLARGNRGGATPIGEQVVGRYAVALSL